MAGLIPFSGRGMSVLPPMGGEFLGLLDNFFGGSFQSGRALFQDTFKMDVKEDAEGYTVEAELPGVKKEEVGLSLENGYLSLCVNREAVSEEKDERKNYLHRERRFSSMRRAVYMADADPQNVKARLEDGVLRVSVGKQTGESNRGQIEIE